ncbi:hypothetical protein [Bradyrhizobium elkanii]|uniref:Transcriptional regulator n=1 Tax=Bradyrhizobium elkanii TaxID=29448 RepID=A0ABV4FBL5_BRAEL|nr:hypothetical protein [Bradyrhizobium elkanii]MCP1752020.1 hypothetical protein [Bradyrhizobium elkanii]MCP1977791.1 hypothetical protein [Bradyrhizobium elkanii]MCS3887691.1 hypothetical protein [Bradyrhizobium elkanii]MCS4213290.1 hypothetical protein [Bradyrhizobium elkanii]MCW2213596.1 hypothetical protein [Bradyrhizobium elkanii]
MPIERLTYRFAVRLKISPRAARSLAKRRQLPRSLSDDGNALLCVDLAEMRHKPRLTMDFLFLDATEEEDQYHN